MKKALSFLILILIPISLHAQSLDRNAQHIRTNHQAEYEQTIRKHAIAEWGNYHAMVVWEINRQADSLMELIKSFESENTNIAFTAIQEWSHDGYKRSNIEKFREIKTFGLKELIKLHCDWGMVKWEYDRQVKAKRAY